ncbi:glutamine synthetase [Halieaceae bacterium IMCC14734]|uniref:Glutamine synthetase n=1 Tax=Candidatus Litorirhabdus singularis TaxID=2518993 RepID=A0ABT3TAP8_9GAMM|nr:glutamine synthetase family protein [Candidatus Litorirhabdus singularis]MCX2979346.1 glutamine synthetase [Candidatus Litorirhabdus singularis]
MSVEADWFLRAHPDITTIEALLPDCNGVMRGKWLPRHKLAKVYQGEFKLPVTALSLDIWGRDVEELVFESGDADGICRPLEGTLHPTPWAGVNHGQVMLSLYNTDDSPYLGDPRHVLRKVLNRCHNAGWRPVVAAELEFSLVTYNVDGIRHSCPMPAGQGPIGGNTYGVDVLQTHSKLLEDIRVACELQELPFDGIVKESAPSQYEINMQHVDNPVLAADQIQLMKRVVKGVAASHGLIASFMAKPFENEAGNGMHVHCSLLDDRGDNLFDSGTPEGTPMLHHAIAGCMEYMSESMAIFAPNYNSYRRFQPGAHAPIAPSWGYENRTVSVRVPAGKNASRRLEQRVAGADANPYLLFAVLLSAIADGIEQQLDPGEAVTGDGYKDPQNILPLYLPESIRLFEESDFIQRNMGSEIQRIYALTKWQENAEFRSKVTELEYRSYLEKL